MEEVKKRWYVVRAISGKEKKLKSTLKWKSTRMKLDQFVSQVLIPNRKSLPNTKW